MSHEHDKEEPQAVSRSIEPRRMLTEAQVLDIVPVGRTTLLEMVKTGRFPRGTYISANRRVWFADQVVQWQNALEEGNPHFNPARGRGRGRRPRLSVIPPDTS
jgi:predicted DNA-binding transcriptional regulator AlpA